MLNWAVTFFIIALIAAVLGFTGIAVAAAGVAKILFVVFLVLFLVSLIAHTTRRVYTTGAQADRKVSLCARNL